MKFWRSCMTDPLPLAGVNIVVTRPREQATQLAEAIVKLGGNCIMFPLLDIAAVADKQPLRAVAARLHEYQLAIFISPNAVRYAMEVIQQTCALPQTLQIATVGLGSAKALLELGVKKVISPTVQFDSEALLALPELQDVLGKKIIIFRGDPGRTLLGDTLLSRGATLEYATCYHRTKTQLEVAAINNAMVDAIYISSSEALQILWQMLDTTAREKFSAVTLFVSNARIAVAAQTQGWMNIITVKDSDAALLNALISWAANRKGRSQ